MNEIIEVKRNIGAPSRVVVGESLALLDSYLPSGKVVVITDANLHRLHPELVNRFPHIIVGLGETNKTLTTVGNIYNELIAMQADRHTFILGVGGGIVTDIAGFVASTYMRGVRFGFVATTLLAQVDASVGGKNGVNVDGFKNMIGVFNQPEFVLCDTTVLGTLPERELRAGLAEVVKSGIIADPKLFELFEQHTFAEFQSDSQLLQKAISGAVRVKARVVEADEREAGERKKLNLGHTFGHAIEKCSSEYIHGEAVAIGISIVCDLSVKMGYLPVTESVRIKQVLQNCGLPTESKIEDRRLLKALTMDKKREAESVDMILIRAIGNCEVRKTSFVELGDVVSKV